MKLEMAKFLQDTIEETALQRHGATGESVHDFVGFMEKVRLLGLYSLVSWPHIWGHNKFFLFP